MKKNFFRYAFVAVALCCGFASCSDDDDDAERPFLEMTSTFNDKNGLAMTYSEAPLMGKEVTFAPNADKTKAIITIKGENFDYKLGEQELHLKNQGLLPGQLTTTLNVTLNNKEDGSTTFEGTDIQNGDTIQYKGTGRKGKFTLDVKVKMQHNALAGKTFEAKPGGFFTPSVFHIDWIADEYPMVDVSTGDTVGSWNIKDALNMMLTMAQIDNQTIPQLFCSLLNKVTFLPDGNITAVYSNIEKKDTTGAATFADAEKEWLNSPLNLATYRVESENTLRLFLNPTQIAAVAAKQGRANENNNGLEGLLGTLVSTINKASAEGVKLGYTLNSDGSISVYLTMETLMPILEAAKPIFEDEAMVEMILALLTEKAGENMAPLVTMFVKPILTNMPMIIETTEKLDLGLRLAATN